MWISYVRIRIFPPHWASLRLPHALLGHHRVWSWVLWATQQVSASYLCYIWQCTYVSATLSIRPILSFPRCVYKSGWIFFLSTAVLAWLCPLGVHSRSFLSFIVIYQANQSCPLDPLGFLLVLPFPFRSSFLLPFLLSFLSKLIQK